MKKWVWYIVLPLVVVVLVFLLRGLLFCWQPTRGYPRQLTSTGRDYIPFWSPDGKKIAFGSVRETYKPEVAVNTIELWIMDANGSHQHPIVSRKAPEFAGYHFQIPNLSWFPDPQSLLCGIWRQKGSNRDSAIWRVFLDGTKRRLTSSKEWAEHPGCSPDGTKIAFLIQVPNPLHGPPIYRLYVADSNGLNRLCLAKGLISGFTWTSDGRGIVYALYDRQKKNYDLWEKSVDGIKTRRISKTTVNEEEPSCSPDGKSILYVASRRFLRGVYITPKDSFRPRKLMSNASHPRWVPGGKFVLLVREQRSVDGRRSWTESWVVDLDGNVIKKIEEGRYETCFSPDGNRYVYCLTGNLWLDRLK